MSGLAIALSLGRFYREHRDIDIAVPENAMGAVAAAMPAGPAPMTTISAVRRGSATGLHLHTGLHQQQTRAPVRNAIDRVA